MFERSIDAYCGQTFNNRELIIVVDLTGEEDAYQIRAHVARLARDGGFGCQLCSRQARVGAGNGRVRRIAIVAMARKLLVALWRYVTQGVVPEGAVFKAA